jgi:hypothetical protein
MLIARKGAGKDHGWSTVELKDTLVSWDSKAELIRVSVVRPARDFRTDARHRYQVFLSVDEIRELLGALETSVSRKGGERIAAALSQSLTPLLRLAAACSERRDGERALAMQ